MTIVIGLLSFAASKVVRYYHPGQLSESPAFSLLSLALGCLGLPLVFIGGGVLLSRWSKQVRPD